MSTRITRVNVSERSLPELKQWIAKELGVTEKYIVLMTPRGSQVKAQFWADEVCIPFKAKLIAVGNLCF